MCLSQRAAENALRLLVDGVEAVVFRTQRRSRETGHPTAQRSTSRNEATRMSTALAAVQALRKPRKARYAL